MTFLNAGDLAQSLQMRRHNSTLKADLDRLSNELATGRKTDVSTAVTGDFGPLAGIERQLGALAAYKSVTDEATLFTGVAQHALEKIDTATVDLAPRLASASNNGATAVNDTLSREAREAFEEAVASLNTSVGGRSVFAGTATDGPALAGADDILSALRTAVAGETTAAGVAAAVDEWFAPDGGFDTDAYLGGDEMLAPFRVGEGDTARFEARADTGAIRETLKNLAMAALTEQGPLDNDEAARLELAETAGRRLLSGQGDWAAMRAAIGLAEADIETAKTENIARTTALGEARNAITSADPFQTAVELQETQTRLQTLYAMTARLSDLSLVNYLR